MNVYLTRYIEPAHAARAIRWLWERGFLAKHDFAFAKFGGPVSKLGETETLARFDDALTATMDKPADHGLAAEPCAAASPPTASTARSWRGGLDTENAFRVSRSACVAQRRQPGGPPAVSMTWA